MENEHIEVDVKKIMREIRAQIHMEEELERLPAFEDIPIRDPEQMNAIRAEQSRPDWAQTEESLSYLNVYYTVPYYWDFTGGRIKVFLKRVVRKLAKCLLSPIVEKQNELNARIVRCLNNLYKSAMELMESLKVQREEARTISNRLTTGERESESRYRLLWDRFDSCSIQTEERLQELMEKLAEQASVAEDQRRELLVKLEEQAIEAEALRKTVDGQTSELEALKTALAEYRLLSGVRLSDMAEKLKEEESGYWDHEQKLLSQNMQLKACANKISALGADLDRAEAVIYPELRGTVQNVFRSVDLTELLGNSVQNLQSAGAAEVPAEAERLKEKYLLLSKKFAMLDRQDGTIAIVCRGLRSQYRFEAIRGEAYRLYHLLKKYSKYRIILVSIENCAETEADTGIYYVPEEDMISFLDQISVRLIVLMEATAGIAFSCKSVFLKYRAIYRLCSQDPLQGLDGYSVDQLRHLNDLGFQDYVVYSNYAREKLEQNGFRNVRTTVPVISRLREKRFPSAHEQFVVGFASSPMEEKQFSCRGIQLLISLADRAQDVLFIILWRDGNIIPPAELVKCKNTELRYGEQEMGAFYQEIDALCIPYADEKDNHACSLSALEAMSVGVPVLTTEAAGISELVRRTGIGVTTETSAEGLLRGLSILRGGFAVSETQLEELRGILDPLHICSELEQAAESYRPPVIETLDEWKLAVRAAGQELASNPAELKAYYEQNDVAERYTQTRFADAIGRSFDVLERASVSAILDEYSQGKPLRILDVASGDGRILQEDLSRGICTAVDSSRAMLDLIASRFGAREGLRCVQMDYLQEELPETYHAVTVFRYLRHFSYGDRRKLYQKLRNNLKDRGLLLFDVPNIYYEFPSRSARGWGNYPIYDMFWSKDSIIRELEENGFQAEYIHAVGTGLDAICPEQREQPVTWTVGALKK